MDRVSGSASTPTRIFQAVKPRGGAYSRLLSAWGSLRAFSISLTLRDRASRPQAWRRSYSIIEKRTVDRRNASSARSPAEGCSRLANLSLMWILRFVRSSSMQPNMRAFWEIENVLVLYRIDIYIYVVHASTWISRPMSGEMAEAKLNRGSSSREHRGVERSADQRAPLTWMGSFIRSRAATA